MQQIVPLLNPNEIPGANPWNIVARLLNYATTNNPAFRFSISPTGGLQLLVDPDALGGSGGDTPGGGLTPEDVRAISGSAYVVVRPVSGATFAIGTIVAVDWSAPAQIQTVGYADYGAQFGAIVADNGDGTWLAQIAGYNYSVAHDSANSLYQMVTGNGAGGLTHVRCNSLNAYCADHGVIGAYYCKPATLNSFITDYPFPIGSYDHRTGRLSIGDGVCYVDGNMVGVDGATLELGPDYSGYVAVRLISGVPALAKMASGINKRAIPVMAVVEGGVFPMCSIPVLYS